MPGDDIGHVQRVNGSNGSHAAPPATPALDAFPFVVGCRRSGTTLVRAILHSHPLIAVPPESRFLLALAPEVTRPLEPARLAEDLAEHDGFARWQLRRPAVVASFRDDPPRTYTDAMRRLYGL